MSEVKKAYPNSYKELGDPNEMLAVKVYKSTCKGIGKEHSTVRYSLREGNHTNDPWKMNDGDRQNYFVSLVKWVKNNYVDETHQEMITKRVPGKKISSRVVNR